MNVASMKCPTTVYFWLLAALLAFGAGCAPYQEEELTDVRVDLRDSLTQRLFTFQHLQQTDSLVAHFSDRNPTYRYLAVVAFASIRDSSALESITPLLADPVAEVRAGAAYALGQIGSPRAEEALLRAFDRYDTAGLYRRANRAILEAIGKVGSLDNLKALATISTYQKTDTALLEGQSLGIFHYALREKVLPEGTARMLDLAVDPGYPPSARLIAANYLSRFKTLEIDSLSGAKLAGALSEAKDPRLRMALAVGLSKARTATALAALLRMYPDEEDYRVRCSILRALGNFEYAQVQSTLLAALRDKNRHIAAVAAQFFLEKGVPEDATLYWRLTRDSLPWQAQIPMFAAALRHLPESYSEYRGALNAQLRRRFETTQSPFVKVAALGALTEFPWNYRYIYRVGIQATEPIVRSAAIQSLATISANSMQIKGMNSAQVSREFAQFFQEAILSNDPSLVAPAAEALTQTNRDFRPVLDSLTFLERAIGQVDSTRDFFTYQSLRQALASLKGEPAPFSARSMPVKDIDWALLTSYSVEPQVLIRTNKGVIQIRLLPKIAPESVANFLQLAKEGYYRNTYFYRVVPNFVIQGAEGLAPSPVGFTIRSELPPVSFDDEGLLGMASSGNHTESTQFFITHSPALHLDGNYTLFGRVVAGMEVVHQIQIGDQIEDILIQ